LLAYDEDDLVDMVEVRDRFRVREFYRSKLAPLRALAKDPFTGPPSESALRGELDLRGKVVPIVFKMIRPNAMSCDVLLQRYQKELQAIIDVDLSANNFMDDDLEPISGFVSKLPNCRYVNLSSNRSSGKSPSGAVLDKVDAALLRILALAHIQWVAIAVNPIASIDRKDLFDRLCVPSLQAHLLKLIWVPEAWLPAGNWKALVRDASLHVRVEAQHKAFYATHSDV
jgi:hypothetical protein